MVAIPVLSIYYFCAQPQSSEEKVLKRVYIVFLAIAAIGLICGALVGRQRGYVYLRKDLIDSVYLVLAPSAALATGITLQNKVFSKLFNYFLLAAVSFIFISFLFLDRSGIAGSFLRGDSTATRYAQLYLGFYGLALAAEGRNYRTGYVFVLVSFVQALLAFSKWTLPYCIIIIACLYIIYLKKYRLIRQHVIFSLVGGMLTLLTIWVAFQSPLPDILAQKRGYRNFKHYWRGRVVLEYNPSTIPYTDKEIVLRDSGRFDMWQDIVDRTLESPLTGIGIGARPYSQYNVGAHNVFITLLGSFGFPLFVSFILSGTVLLKTIYNLIGHSYRLKVVFWGWFAYVLIAYSVGTSYAQVFNLYFAFLPLAVFIQSGRQNQLAGSCNYK